MNPHQNISSPLTISRKNSDPAMEALRKISNYCFHGNINLLIYIAKGILFPFVISNNYCENNGRSKVKGNGGIFAFFTNTHDVIITNNIIKIDNRKATADEDRETIIITKEVVLGKLMELKVDKTPGPDGMYPRVRKEMVGEIANALVVIYQNSLDTGWFPQIGKQRT